MDERLPLSLVGIVLVAAGTILFAIPHSPVLGDFAEWTYHGVLFRQVLSGSAVPGYLLKHYPVPNTLTTFGLGLLMLVLPWQLAAKLWLFLQMLAVTTAARQLQLAANSSPWTLVIVTAGATLGIPFWAGFSNFLLGCGCVMLLVALLFRGRCQWLLVAALLLLTFFCHMIPFAFACAVVAAYAWQHRAPRLLLSTIPGLLATLWYLLARAFNGDADGQAGMIASVRYGSLSFLLFKGNTFAKSWGLINPASGEHDSVLLAKLGATLQVLLIGCDLAVAAGVAFLLLRRAAEATRERTPDRFFWAAAAVCFAVGALLPGAMSGVSDPGGRVMEMVSWCGVLVAACSVRQRRVAQVTTLCTLPLLGANCFLLASVAMQPERQGEVAGPLPAVLRQFGHVYYADCYKYYGAIQNGTMDMPIYPTALFLKSDKALGHPR